MTPVDKKPLDVAGAENNSYEIYELKEKMSVKHEIYKYKLYVFKVIVMTT